MCTVLNDQGKLSHARDDKLKRVKQTSHLGRIGAFCGAQHVQHSFLQDSETLRRCNSGKSDIKLPVTENRFWQIQHNRPQTLSLALVNCHCIAEPDGKLPPP